MPSKAGFAALMAGIETIPGETGPLQLAKDGVKTAVNDVDAHFSSSGVGRARESQDLAPGGQASG